MLPFKTLIIISRKTAMPVYQQIANQFVALIRDGLLKPGSSLPSSREMASLLNVHRKTVVAAYDELNAQDWIETMARKGVSVSQHLPETKPRTFKPVAKASGYGGDTGFSFQKINLPASQIAQAWSHRLIINDGFPDARIAPVDLLMKEYRTLSQRSTVLRLTMFGNARGSVKLRTAIAKFLSETRGLSIGANNILMTHGAQMAIFLVANMILKRGSSVVVGEPNYFMANRIFEQCGAKLLQVAVDENGIDVDQVEKICRRKKPDLLYLIPHHHHPTTVTLSPDRRMKLLQLISAYSLPVIEDDYDYDFHYNHSPILPLASADHSGNVMYIGSLAKSLTTSLRMGYLIASENFIRNATQFRSMIDIQGDQVLEEAMAVLFNDGTMQRHLKKSLKLYHERRDVFCNLMNRELGDAVSFDKPAGGMAVWVMFSKKFPLSAVAQAASAHGLYLSDGSFYNSGTVNYNSLRMGFASLNKKEMEETCGILKKCLK